MSVFFKIAAGINALSVFGHGAMGFNDVFPVLDKSPATRMRAAAKIGWMEGCGYFAMSAILLYKISESGAGQYERVMLLIIFIQDLLAGLAYIRSTKLLPPLLPLWGTPALVVIGYALGGL